MAKTALVANRGLGRRRRDGLRHCLDLGHRVVDGLRHGLGHCVRLVNRFGHGLRRQRLGDSVVDGLARKRLHRCHSGAGDDNRSTRQRGRAEDGGRVGGSGDVDRLPVDPDQSCRALDRLRL